MEPITLDEMFMAAAAGEYSGELPEPVTRFQYYMKKIAEGGSSVNPEDIDAAIESYLNSHDADIVTEAELTQALAGYYNKTDIDTALGGKAAADHNHSGMYAPASHTHAQADVTGLEDALAGKSAVSHFHDDRYYTESEIDTALAGKAAASHSHDDRYYTESEVDTALAGKAAASHSHDDRYYTESEVDTALAGKAAVSHAHDDRYYTEIEIDNKLSGKSNTGHTHDDRYYTEDETDTLLSGKADSSDIPDVSSFITKAVNDLTNYYTKSETYTQTEIDNMVSAIPKFAIEVVQALPSQNISPTTVYLLTVQSGQQGNMYDEYIHVGNSWELLGTQTVDLSGYYTSAQVDALLSGLPVAGHTHDDRYYTETEIDGKIQTINTALSGKAASDHTHDDRYYTETEIDNKLGEKSNTGHSHVVADVTGLDSALAGKAPASHSHAQTDITGLDTALAGKSNTGHSHAVADVTGLDSALSGKAPASHTHALADVTGLADALAAKADAAATQTALNAKQDALTAGENITIETVNGELTISATDTTYSAGSGISISNGEISNSAPNVQADWNASGTAAEILNKPTIPNYSNATTSAAGLMSAADKEKLDNNNAGYKFKIWEGSQNLVANSDLSTGYALTNFSALEIRYAIFYNHSANYIKTIRITRKDTELSFGEVIPAEKYEYSSGTLSLSICGLTIGGSHIYLTYPEDAVSFWVFGVYGYK